MDPRRLLLLVELSRLGSMREVAETHTTTTSNVSQQLAALAREVGTPLIEPTGRRVRLTPAGRRLSDHAVGILAALETARLDLDPNAEPHGVVRVGGFATAVHTSLLPVVADLRVSHPQVSVMLAEFEPLEAHRLLVADELDLALTYDYDLAPLVLPDRLVATTLWSTPWGLGVPAQPETTGTTDSTTDLRTWGNRPWIVNSRHTADEEAVQALGRRTGLRPQIHHRIDNLDLVEHLIESGVGIGLLPLHRPTRAAVRVLPLPPPGVTLTAYAVTHQGRDTWPPLRLVRDHVIAAARHSQHAKPGPTSTQ